MLTYYTHAAKLAADNNWQASAARRAGCDTHAVWGQLWKWHCYQQFSFLQHATHAPIEAPRVLQKHTITHATAQHRSIPTAGCLSF